MIAVSRLSATLSTILSGERLLWTILFCWIMFTTVLAPNPVYAVVAGFSMVAFFLFFASITTRFSLEDVLMALLAATVLVALVSLVVYVAVPSLGRSRVWVGNVQVISGRLAGITGNANSIGRMCCIGLIIIVLCWRRLRAFSTFLPWVLTAILGLTLLLSNSRTSMLVALVVIGVHMLVRGRNLHILVGCMAALFLAFLAIMPFSNDVLIALSRSGRADELATGTSRTLIWSVVTNLSWQRPFFGWGYGSSVFILPQYERFMGHAAPHAHNMILQLWFTTGFVGVVLFLLAIMSRFTLAVVRGERVIIALLRHPQWPDGVQCVWQHCQHHVCGSGSRRRDEGGAFECRRASCDRGRNTTCAAACVIHDQAERETACRALPLPWMIVTKSMSPDHLSTSGGLQSQRGMI